MNGYQSCAHQLHDMGLNVIAITGGKRPGHGWKEFQEKRQSLDQVAALPWRTASGVGVISGVGGLRIFDFDEKRAGYPPVDFTPVSTVLQKLGLSTAYPWLWRSGSGNGWGLAVLCFEAIPAGVLSSNGNGPGVFEAPGVGFDHLELRWRDCQTLLPPSKHPEGPGYRWQNGTPTAPPATVTAAQVIAAFQAVTLRPQSAYVPPMNGSGHGNSYAAAALRAELDTLGRAIVGTRNETLNRCAFALGQLCAGGELDRGDVQQRLLAGALAIGLGEGEAAATISSGLAAGAREPRSAPPRPLPTYRPVPDEPPGWLDETPTPEENPFREVAIPVIRTGNADSQRITRIPYGVRVHVGPVTLDATNMVRDRGTIRATVTARRGSDLVFRDNVNLTGQRARARYLAQLEKHGVTGISETLLLELDEALRYQREDVPETQEKVSLYDGSPDFSEKVTLSALEAQLDTWLLLEDRDVLALTLAAIAAHRMGGESPWLLLVAPPSGSKTEILRATWATPGIYCLSELTARTFASGLDEGVGGNDPSLLKRLGNEVLVLKDLTTILEMPHDERQAVLAQLREIYDGRFDKTFGTGKEVHWQGRLGFLAGVTPIIDQHYEVMGMLGPRFLQLRVQQTKRDAAAIMAMEQANAEDGNRKALANAVARFLAQVPTAAPSVGDDVVPWLASVADLIARARSPVYRDGYRHELAYAPAPELPPRLAKQLFALLRGLMLVANETAVSTQTRRRVGRVAFDCVPATRQVVLRSLAATDTALPTTSIAAGVQFSTTTVRRTLEDLQALEVVLCEKGGPGKADLWRLHDGRRSTLIDLLRLLDLAR